MILLKVRNPKEVVVTFFFYKMFKMSKAHCMLTDIL